MHSVTMQRVQLCFHSTVVLYYLVTDYFMLDASKSLFETNHPVTEMFLCGVTHFFTCWNQVFQQSYFILSLVQDILSFSCIKSHVNTRKSIETFRQYLFGPILLPSACLTMINFWGIFWLVPHLMLDDLVALYPSVLNHAMHSLIVPLAFMEAFISPQQPVQRSTGFNSVTVLMAAYAGWIYSLGFLTGQWPYPFLEVMNLTQLAMFTPTMFIHGYFWYFTTDFLVQYLWSSHSLKLNKSD